MNKLEEKQDKLMFAVSRLKKSLLEYEQHNSDTVRDGVINVNLFEEIIERLR